LKLPLLLTRFLYQHKRLNLPGIGSFALDPSAVIPAAHTKDLHTPAVGIEFKNKIIEEPDEDLIDYIRTNTGKMRSLAVADLFSYLTLGKELVNIGKPFHLEGIGILTKNRHGEYEFVPGEYAPLEGEEELGAKSDKRRFPGKVQENEQEPVSQMRKGLVIIAIMIGLGIIGGGGYLLYRKTKPEVQTSSPVSKQEDTPINKTDTPVLHPAPPVALPVHTQPLGAKYHPSGDSLLYKFIILETHNKIHALKRYNQLLGYQLKINLYTLDSSFFKVYFSFPARPRDTVRIKDSLSNVYAHSVRIER
jgi:hypothetical protein